MICPKCGNQQPKDKQFCPVCGYNVVLHYRMEDGFVPGRMFRSANPPVAYYKDKRGNRIPVDKKGNVTEDIYYKKNDPRGWKMAGFKDTRGYERSVHMDEKGNELK